LAALASVAGAPFEASARGDLEALFAAADADPRGVAPLIVEASATISSLDGDEGHELAERLEPYCRRAFFGPERLPGMDRLGLRIHEVASGELPGRIARRNRIDAGLLPYLNEGYDERRLRVGQELKVLEVSDGGLMLIVDRARFRVSVWKALADGRWVLAAYVAVGLGAPGSPTPTGSTRVTARVRHPEWRDPNTGVVYPPKDPGNVLGGYWMELDAEGLGEEGIGLHGYTAEPPDRGLGKRGSNGCVRMLQEDIDRVFHLALEGTAVEIVP
jgi:lipoprotein-anchoring transpeptidase ErfK/SrfK